MDSSGESITGIDHCGSDGTLVGGGGWRGELISRQDLVISLQLQRSGGEQEVALYTEAR